MKLRVISLTNVRHFVGVRASLSGIGDGITVLSEPNEFGKSTFFDGLHALFFDKHRSSGGSVKALRPHAGGAPEVMVEVELASGRFAIAKRWLSRPMARVTDAATGRIVAQDDEAEDWIARLLGAGPSGLLWVRQGLMGLEPEGSTADERNERARGLAARRDLMSSVAGEIDALTGGARMDRVTARTTEALARLATATGKPVAGGEWRRAVDEAAELAAREAALRADHAVLAGDLRRRAEVLRRQAVLADPQAVAAREAALVAAQQAHAAAVAHAERLAEAARAVAMADLEAQVTVAEMARLDRLVARVAAATAAVEATTGRAAQTRARAEDLADRHRGLAEAAVRAAETCRALRQRLQAAQKARVAETARVRAAELDATLQRALALQDQRQADQAQRSLLRVTPTTLAAAEAAQREMDRLTTRAEAQAVTVRFTYQGVARALIGGVAVGDDPLRLPGPAEVTLPGLGLLHIDPGAGRSDDLAAARAAAAAEVARCLLACGADDLAGARLAMAAADRLDDALRRTGPLLAALAPKGVDALRLALATARAEAGAAAEGAEDPAEVEPLLAQAEQAETGAAAAATTARALATESGDRRAEAEAELKSALRGLEDARAEAGDPAALDRGLADLRALLPGQMARRDARRALVATLTAEAPDLQTAVAGLNRAGTAREQAAEETARLREELASLNARIEVLAEQGIEETLDTISGARSDAEARARRYEIEVQALTRLRRALEDARATARDAYFGPVMAELAPLLAILHPGAVLQIDDQSLLPVALTRQGQAEPLDILSGGTREQLAVLTRLAFARLFARGGQRVPMILDDALVHSDDDRIEAMFTALHRVAADQQILVLTCRQRAFAALGGDRARVTVTPI